MAGTVEGFQRLNRDHVERSLFSSSTKIRVAALHDVRYKLEHEGKIQSHTRDRVKENC
jgi:hypothetical protein